MSLESNSSWTLGLLIVLLFLFVGFIIAVIIWVIIPMHQIKQTINRSAADIQNTLNKLNQTSDDVEDVVGIVNQTSNNVNEIVDQVKTFIPQTKSALCEFLPNLPMCTA